ncbi:Copia protein [Symbiodinium microadriaticum]|uniref:Copia protein n=1 Tax=Symbiodinium microadriaticum TaxID=2951 RepID=A0A1Q9CVZ6_SYMMI|nr:Copia protein [Symbiodinium microadriaticum]
MQQVASRYRRLDGDDVFRFSPALLALVSRKWADWQSEQAYRRHIANDHDEFLELLELSGEGADAVPVVDKDWEDYACEVDDLPDGVGDEIQVQWEVDLPVQLADEEFIENAFRDKSKKELTFECEGVVYILLQGVSDDSIWFIAKREVPAEDKDRWHGVLIIYVDDLLGFATTAILRELFAAVRRLWKLSDPQWVTIDAPISFCGLEIQAIEGGFKISQRAYLKELFSRYDVQSSVSSPLSSWRDPEDEHPLNPDAVRQAQALTGALLWASTKSRPDIAFAVSKLGQFAVKAPSTVIEKGFQVLKYLYGTDDLWIEYRRCLLKTALGGYLGWLGFLYL